jgi:hypothetical protein
MKVPTLNSQSSTLSEKLSMREEYLAEISKRKLECAPIRARMQNAVPDPGNDRINRVNAILGRTTAPLMAPDDVRLQTLLLEIQDLQNAVCVIDGQIQIEIRLASNRLLEAVKPEAVRLGNNFAKAFLALRDAHSAYSRFVDQVEDTGCNVETLRLYPTGLGDPSDRSGNYPYALREFANAGYLSKSEVPEYI